MKVNKNFVIRQYQLPIEVEGNEKEGFIAHCSVWSDCYAQGDSIEEALNEIFYVASSLIELYREEDLKLPLKLKKESQVKSSTLHFDLPLIVSGGR